MGLTAFVAITDTDGNYDLYYSEDGAREYLLRPVLTQYLDEENLSGGQPLPEFYPDAVAEWLPSRIDPGEFDDEPLIMTDAVATGVSQTGLLSAIPSYDVEVLYVVSDETVEVIIPIVLTARALYRLFSVARLEFYHLGGDFNATLQAMQSGESADVMLADGPVTPSELQSLPGWVKKTLEQGHRYMLFKCHQLLSEEVGQGMKLFLATGAVDISLRQSSRQIPFTPALPIRVPWIDGDPAYPINGGTDADIGAAPKIHGSKLRYGFYPDMYEILEDIQSEDQVVAVNGANAGPMAAALHESFGENFAWAHIPDKFADHIRTELA